MKKWIWAFAFTFAFSLVQTSSADEMSDIKACLSKWKVHPFTEATPAYRVLGTAVKVLGVGSNVKDSVQTEKPELVLVKPNVSVLSKVTLELMNPNGWYCLDSKVAVLSKSTIELHCKANLASVTDSVAVLAKDQEPENGVTVLGKSEIHRKNCP